ncbi:MAG: TetR/AcrR family transcriptional regulator [Alphaproteobacteria bacterium]|nr:TetR/AcrR family transcriptional regulator [Alphaproteobacteria bacterium]MBL6937580.1 TetR/AcrR family transcriptional regulator [Alphaproteobacteria bacterium]MBL7098918.1 TetR/AcrR family transcriptional regulator [Alphaproteobacteria bacterium]
MKIGRPRSFCVEDALDRATDVFWAKGYQGASLSDLTDAMGINAPSLYACFKNKEGLFRAVLDRYEEKGAGFLRAVLDAPTARDAAELFLKGVADRATDPNHHPPGCLLVQTGMTGDDQRIPNEVARHRAEKELALRERFACAQRAGDLAKNADPAALALYLVTMANGMCVQASAGATREDLQATVQIALSAWPGSEGGKSKPKRKAEADA